MSISHRDQPDSINQSGTSGTISVTAGTPVEAKVGASAWVNRKSLFIQPLDGHIKWGLVSGAGNQDGLIFKYQSAEFVNGENVPVYVDAVSGTVEVFVAEKA